MKKSKVVKQEKFIKKIICSACNEYYASEETTGYEDKVFIEHDNNKDCIRYLRLTVGDLESEIYALKSDFSDLQSEIYTLKSELSSLEDKVRGL